MSDEVYLSDICRPTQWATIPATSLMKSGYPVYGANGVIGSYNEYNHEKPTLLITCRGATCGELNICQPFSYVTGNAMCLDDLDEDGKSIRYDPLYLFWARQDDELVDFAPVNIYAGDSEYLDIAGIRHKEKIVKFRVSSRKQPLPLGKVFPLKSYFVKVAMYGDDIVPLQEWYQIVVNKDAMQNSTLVKVKSPSL